MTILLIDSDDFLPYADICTNVSADLITPYIQVAQMKHLRPVLGKPLYADLLAKVADSVKPVDAVQLSEAYAKLLEALTPWLVYASYSEYLPYSNAMATPFGTVTKRSDYSDPVDAKTLAYMAANAIDNGLPHKNDLIDYLKENFSDDPLYKDMLPCESSTRVSSSTVVPIGKCSSGRTRPTFIISL